MTDTMYRPAQGRPSQRLALAATLFALLVSLAVVGQRAWAADMPTVAPAVAVQPNFVVVQTDDETLKELYASFVAAPGAPPIPAMPNTLNLIAKHGITFNRYYVSYSLCCPSRVTLLTGRYAHNHNVRGNVEPNGGYAGFRARIAYHHNLAVWLQRAGYRTIHIGKFLNGYGDAPYDNGREVPPGWSSWHTVLHADSDHFFYGYELNSNGVIEGPFGDSGSWETREYGERDETSCPSAPPDGKPCNYQTDKLTGLAVQELASTPPDKPFYLQLDYTAPHGDFRHPAGPEPASRYYYLFTGAPLPDGTAEGFNEGNVSDKPRFIREAPRLSPESIHTYRVYYDMALASLRSVDDGVAEIVAELGALHRLRDTYIIFTSDNGFFFGEHRLTGGKFLAYEPSTHLPFLMRGPGIPAGTSSNELAANIDIAPTVLELAHVQPDESLDGRSLVPFATDPTLETRRPVLFESYVQSSDVEENGGGPPAAPPPDAEETRTGVAASSAHASIAAPPKDYFGLILGPYKYIEWPDGEKELYDLERDPYELKNVVRDANYFPIRAFLHRELLRLETCSGAGCRELSPPLPLTRDQRAQLRRERERKHRHRHGH